MNILIIGSRSFNDYELFKSVISDMLCSFQFDDLTILSGGAIGTDSLVKKYCVTMGLRLQEITPNYKIHGKRAPLVRNLELLRLSHSVIAFHDGKSTGTLHVLANAKKMGISYLVYNFVSNSI